MNSIGEKEFTFSYVLNCNNNPLILGAGVFEGTLQGSNHKA